MEAKSNPRVVYVNDQKDNLIVFEAELLDTWKLKCFLNAAQALKDVKAYDPAIVIANLTMGRMDGVDFLLKAKEVVPLAIRIVICEHSEEPLLLSAIRYAQLFDYIKKPFDREEIRIRLSKALVQYETNVSHQNKEVVAQKVNASVHVENQKLKKLIHAKNSEIEKLKSDYQSLKSSLNDLVGGIEQKKLAA
jgi:response regulator RpfG family c-di-GMP phosphodiesterase